MNPPTDTYPCHQPTDGEKRRLEGLARTVRRAVVRMVSEANSGHVGGSLSAADIMIALYFRIMRHDPANPGWRQRDRFILSKGHCTPVLYATLAQAGYFPQEELGTFRRPGSRLQGHPAQHKTPGVEACAGTLGIGISTAVGMALGARLRGECHWYFVLCGDGEQQEGQVWEAAMFAAKHRLERIIAFTDRNRLQTDGDTEEVMPLEPLADKWESFGWNVQIIDGHDFGSICAAVGRAQAASGRPNMIIANTVKGRGVSFMENGVKWHGTPPSAEECARALEELAP